MPVRASGLLLPSLGAELSPSIGHVTAGLAAARTCSHTEYHTLVRGILCVREARPSHRDAAAVTSARRGRLEASLASGPGSSASCPPCHEAVLDTHRFQLTRRQKAPDSAGPGRASPGGWGASRHCWLAHGWMKSTTIIVALGWDPRAKNGWLAVFPSPSSASPMALLLAAGPTQREQC